MRFRLLTLLLVLVGCDRSDAHNALAPLPTAVEPATLETSSDVPAVAAAFNLGLSATRDQMIALERRFKRNGEFRGQACGITILDGTTYGFYSNIYEATVPGYETPQYLHFGHIQHAEHPIVSVSGPGFRYQLVDGAFVLRPDASGP